MVAAAAEPAVDGDTESSSLLHPSASTPKPPRDSFHLAYVIYFILGTGYLIPWNAFITAVDYFSYLYPDASVDRVFSVVYMVIGLICLLFIVAYAHKSDSYLRINVGLGVFVVSLLVVPIMDVVYIKGRVGVDVGFYVSVGAVALSGIADALVQGGVIGAAGEMPKRYMQAVVAGTAASGVIISILRILTKYMYPQDAHGLRKSANLYFIVSIVVMVICIILHNVAHHLPVIKHYKELKEQAVNRAKKERPGLTDSQWRSTLWDTVGTIKWFGFANIAIYAVTLAIFPGFITEDVHSQILRDWYPIILITSYNVFDLVGKSLTLVCVLENANIAIAASFARLLFLPLYLGCLHGPQFLHTEAPVTIITCLLGLTNGYFTSVLMMLGPKTVPIQHAETAGIVLVLFIVIGLAAGSVVSWFWVI